MKKFFISAIVAMLLLGGSISAQEVVKVSINNLDSATRALFLKEANAHRYGQSLKITEIDSIVVIYEISGVTSRHRTGPSTQYLTIYTAGGKTLAAVTRVSPVETAKTKNTTVTDLFKAGYHQGDDPEFGHETSTNDESRVIQTDW